MSKALLASVFIDTYNYGHFVEDAINSVLSQDFPADQLEVLVVDDGSTDDTRERVTKYEPRVQYLYKPNGGQASAFNFGLNRARGDLIFFLDADDYWLPGKLRSLVWAFEQNPGVGMIYHRLQQFDQTANLGSDLFFVPLSGFLPEHFRDLLCYLIPPTSSLAFRRTVLEPLLPVPEVLKTQADAYLAALVVFLAPILAVPQTLGVYRLHGANLYSQSDTDPVKSELLRRRIATRQAFLEQVTSWLTLHGYKVRRPLVRAYLRQWTIAQEEDAFLLTAPSRFRYFSHIFAASLQFAPRRTWRHNLVAAANTFGALFLGYPSSQILDSWRRKAKSAFRF
jgi:glycosyltransferase involved in cell wall biosynthesis